jgi:hypothetical protein
MAKCKGCGAEIEFIKLKSGKIMPIDSKKRLFYMNNEDADNLQWLAFWGHEPHFATCPQADKFRKWKGGD